MCPVIKSSLHCLDDTGKRWKILVMQAKPAGQFPDAFYWIQIGTVGRKVVQLKAGLLLLSPVLVHFGMMILGVVTYDHNAFALHPALFPEELHEVPEGLPIESIRLP